MNPILQSRMRGVSKRVTGIDTLCVFNINYHTEDIVPSQGDVSFINSSESHIREDEDEN